MRSKNYTKVLIIELDVFATLEDKSKNTIIIRTPKNFLTLISLYR